MEIQDFIEKDRVNVFPAAWLWLVDQLIPSFVKQGYSSKESWKDKPFSEQDARFYGRGIEELSELFTEERPRQLPTYLNHPRFRSAYLLYFLPLQAAKFVSLLRAHPHSLDVAFKHAQSQQGTLRVWDLGAGPGTASIAVLLCLLEQRRTEDLKAIEFEWYDTNRHILEDGQKLVEAIATQFPRLRGKVSVRLHVKPWWDCLAQKEAASLILMGHVLNETPDRERSLAAVGKILGKVSGGGLVILEPASRNSAHRLAEIREAAMNEAEGFSLWGPCLHTGPCPLQSGRDWCHFSVPVEIPGKWFKSFSRHLGAERTWLKFSYLWIASKDYPSPAVKGDVRRAISDPLHDKMTAGRIVLLCEPDKAARVRLPRGKAVYRGQLVRDANETRIEARPHSTSKRPSIRTRK